MVFYRRIEQIKAPFIRITTYQKTDAIRLPPLLENFLNVVTLSFPLEGLRPLWIAASGVALNVRTHAAAMESSLRLNLPVCPEIVALCPISEESNMLSSMWVPAPMIESLRMLFFTTASSPRDR